jgi:hypothetical protein
LFRPNPLMVALSLNKRQCRMLSYGIVVFSVLGQSRSFPMPVETLSDQINRI